MVQPLSTTILQPTVEEARQYRRGVHHGLYAALLYSEFATGDAMVKVALWRHEHDKEGSLVTDHFIGQLLEVIQELPK